MLDFRLLNRDRNFVIGHEITLSGRDDAPTLVVVNGFGYNLSVWQGLLPWLERHFRVVRFNWPIHPDHYDVARYSKLDSFAEDLLGIIDRVGGEPCAVLTHSMGGMVGMLAARYKPEWFLRFVMLTPSPCFLRGPDFPGSFEKSELDALMRSLGDNYTHWVEQTAPLVLSLPAGSPEVETFCRQLLEMRPDVALSMALTIFHMDVRDRLGGFITPTTIVQTRDDTVVPVDVAYYLRDRWPNSRVEIIEAAGHLPHLTHPVEVLRVLEGCL